MRSRVGERTERRSRPGSGWPSARHRPADRDVPARFLRAERDERIGRPGAAATATGTNGAVRVRRLGRFLFGRDLAHRLAFAHRSHPVLQSCSGTSPAVWLRWPRATTTSQRESSGMDSTSCSISARRRVVTASTRRRPDGESVMRTCRRSWRPERRVTRPFLTKTVAHPRCRRRCHRHRLGESGHALRPTAKPARRGTGTG